MFVQATPCPTDPKKEMINDGACWTVISTDEAKYRFCDAMTSVKKPIAPVPVVEQMTPEGYGNGKSKVAQFLD
jgi:recombining binding protein (suppressor of hairless)